MKYLKDILNLKENKKYKVTIIILVVIILVLQTSLSISNKKIQILNARINKVQIANVESNQNSEIVNNVDEFISTENEEKNNSKIDKSFQEAKKSLIEKYIDIAEEDNKKYVADIKEGKEILVFETMYLDMTEGQIKKSLTKISSDEFGVNIVKDKIGSKECYKIYLIEKEK